MGLLAFASAGAASKFFVKAQVDQNTVNLGDQLMYTVEIMTAGEAQFSPDVLLPGFGKNFQVGDIFTRSSISILNGRTYIVNFKEVHLTAIKTGSITIPASKVELIDPKTKERYLESTNPVTLTVKSAVGQAARPTPPPEIDVMRPIKRQARVTVNQWLPFGISALLIMAIVGTMIVVRNRPAPEAKQPVVPIDPRTPEQRAFDELEAAMKLKEAQRYTEYFTALSAILRKYLAEQFKLHAEEATTKEVLEEMEKNRFKQFFMDRYRDYAKACDKIKYAGKMPDPDEIEKIFPETKSLIKIKDAQESLPEPESLTTLDDGQPETVATSQTEATGDNQSTELKA